MADERFSASLRYTDSGTLLRAVTRPVRVSGFVAIVSRLVIASYFGKRKNRNRPFEALPRRVVMRSQSDKTQKPLGSQRQDFQGLAYSLSEFTGAFRNMPAHRIRFFSCFLLRILWHSAGLAQLAEHMICIHGAAGSTPAFGFCRIGGRFAETGTLWKICGVIWQAVGLMTIGIIHARNRNGARNV